MKYNKQELIALASQSSHNFDREGVMILKERHDGFFRRSEGCSVRWFRLRGNLLFYLKGPESWCQPSGVIILEHHQVKVEGQDEKEYWPFQIVWENGICFKLATFQEHERTLWMTAIKQAPYRHIQAQFDALKEKLGVIRPNMDISTYRLQKGIVTDMNEVPLCEMALSCDNLLCDNHGRPPSPVIVIYVKLDKGLCVKYGSTEIIETCSNPCFSKTILFRASDGLTGAALVRIMVYDVKELFSEISVPIGYTSMSLSTIQEAQRLRVAIVAQNQKTVGFVTINGWSLEPSYIGTSPSHTNDRNSIDIPHKVLCHRRSHSLPPRLGLKLKFPSYGSLLKQNFVNSHQVTYRFHSGLGGDITVHEIMAEPKLCYTMPIQLLDIYIGTEKELLDELTSVGDICGVWQNRQLELASSHASLLKHYYLSRRSMLNIENKYFKESCKKDDANLQFAPVNLHLQRMWVHNDTLNKTGFHDIVTAGAFTSHVNKSERTGGLIRLVQQLKDMNHTKDELSSMANKIQSQYDNVVAVRRLREEVSQDMDRIIMLIHAKQYAQIVTTVEGIKSKVKSILAQWEPAVVEETLYYIGGLRSESDKSDNQTLSTIMRLTEQMATIDTNPDCDTFASSSSSSKDTSPTGETPTLSSSVPNVSNYHNKKLVETELHFHNDYFTCETDNFERGPLNCSFRSVKLSKPKLDDHKLSFDSTKRHGSLRYDFKSTASLEQVSYKSLVDSLRSDKRKTSESRRERITVPTNELADEAKRGSNLIYLRNLGITVEDSLSSLVEKLSGIIQKNESNDKELEAIRGLMDDVRSTIDKAAKWLRVSHAALRLRCESPQWTLEHAALQTRRDTCFSQALSTATTGLLCWLCSIPTDTIVKILSSGLGPLCGFEGLLSLYNTEKAMWGDMVVAVEDLQTVMFTLTKVGHSNTSIPQVTGTRGALTVHIPISDTLYARFLSKEHLSFTITAVFFNIGVNEKATLAEALGETTPQYHSNSDNFDRLNKYYHRYSKIFPTDHMTTSRSSSRTKPLEEVMENLRIAVHKKVPKNFEVLHLASLATRQMNGIRFTSCKSAKDRTGMSVTLEQCSILASEYHLAEHEVKKTLNVMRSEGCRRENTYKNIGIRKYAFTKKQVMALPIDYRPPTGSYGSSQT